MCREGAWAELTVKVTFVAIDSKPDARILNKAEISALFFCLKACPEQAEESEAGKT